MSLIEIVLIAIGLAMDAFAVSLCAAAAGHTSSARARFRLVFHFGLFQALMPILGWLLGVGVVGLIENFDHWIAFGLLGFIGVRMIRSGMDGESQARSVDPSRGWTLVALSIATSIDALAIGLSLGVLRVSIWIPALLIGVITSAICLGGIIIGTKLGTRFGSRMEITGGVILIIIGSRILFTHLI